MNEQKLHDDTEQKLHGTEPTFTLSEARHLLALEECRQHGHSWDVDEVRTYADPAGTPVSVTCSTCQRSHPVTPTGVL